MIRRPPRSTPLSLHDALPISQARLPSSSLAGSQQKEAHREREALRQPGAEQVRQESVQVCWLQEGAFQAWLAQQAQREREALRPPGAEQVRQEAGAGRPL